MGRLTDRKAFLNHSIFFLVQYLIGFLFVISLGIYFLEIQLNSNNYLYYYFSPYQTLLPGINTGYILPVGFLLILIIFAGLLCLTRCETDLKASLRKVFLWGCLVTLYILLITLEGDTRIGEFFKPNFILNFQLRTYYYQAFPYVSLFLFYTLIIRNYWGNKLLFKPCKYVIFFCPLIPLYFDYSSLTHFVLLALSFVFNVYFFKPQGGSVFDKKLSSRSKSYLFLGIIIILSILFRLWNFSYWIQYNMNHWIIDTAYYGGNLGGFWEDKPLPYLQNTPSYSYLLYLIFKIFGPNIKHALMVQSIINGFIPLGIFFICREIFGEVTAWLACICATLSYDLILYSGLLARGSFGSFFWVLSILLLINLIKTPNNFRKAFMAGFFISWTVFLDAATGPLALLILVPIKRLTKKFLLWRYLGIVFLGVILAELSFNWIIFEKHDQVYLLGRKFDPGVGHWNTYSHEEGEALIKQGFHPLKNTLKSFVNLAQDPINIGTLWLKKGFKEMQGFLFSPVPIFFDPTLLSENTFFSRFLSFYYYPLFFIGLIAFLVTDKYLTKHKIILGFPILYCLGFYSFFWVGGTMADYRIINQPLFLIFFSYGLKKIGGFLLSNEGGKFGDLIQLNKDNNQKTDPNKNNKQIYNLPYMLKIGSMIVFLGSLMVNHLINLNDKNFPFFYKSKIEKAVYKYTPWHNLSGEISQLLVHSNGLKKEIMLAKSGLYDMAFQAVREFGLSNKHFQIAVLLNGRILRIIDIPKHPEWIIFKNLFINSGKQVLEVKIFPKKYTRTMIVKDKNYFRKKSPLSDHSYPKPRVLLKKFRMVKTK